jgi:phage shock protein E
MRKLLPQSSVIATACLALAVLISPATGQDKGKDKAATQVDHVDAAGAAKLLAGEKKPVVLDVRTPDEYAEGHIAGSKMIDFRAADFEKKVSALDRSKSYLVHCRSGGRSTESLKTFEKLGFKHIIHLDGGISGWEAAGQPVTK